MGATPAFLADLITQLEQRVKTLTRHGDTHAATLLQRQINALQATGTHFGVIARLDPRFADLRKAFDGFIPNLILALDPRRPHTQSPNRWWALDPDGVDTLRTRGGDPTAAVHFDYGARGSVTITADRLIYTGEIAKDPQALLIGVLHIKAHWGSRGFRFRKEDRALGPEFLFQFAAAAEMLGVKYRGYNIPEERREGAHALQTRWNRILSELLTKPPPSAPSRPPAYTRDTRPTRLANTTVAAL